MKFIVYDISILVLFLIFVSIFLYKRRKHLKREGLLFLYKTKWGIKLINNIGKKYDKTLKVLSYISIGIGYSLMGVMFYLFYTILKVYVSRPDIAKAIKVPPIMPLIPYLPQIFKLDFLPPFYFTYWIIIIAVIAMSHEVAHGIFAARNKVRIKKTGFGFFPFFLPVFLAAFVELDEKQMSKKSKLNQMAILSAGAFANILTAIFFFFVLWAFFALTFAPVGVTFDTYSYSLVNIPSISSINNIQVNNPSYEQILNLVNSSETNLSRIETDDKNYFITQELLEKQKSVGDYVLLYDDSPAINAGLTGAITEINGVKIDSREKLIEEILKYSPGEEIKIKTKTEKEFLEYNIVLGENPENKNLPLLGIGFSIQKREGVIGKITSLTSLLKKPNIYYETKFDVALFIYNLLWWLVLISISVGLINMLPVGIFDGGRFLYLTVWGVTKDKEKAEKFFKFLTYFILFLALVLMILWFLGVFGKV